MYERILKIFDVERAFAKLLNLLNFNGILDKLFAILNLSDKFFENNRKAIFYAKIGLTLSVFSIFQGDKINYGVYFSLYFTGIYALLLLRKFVRREAINVDLLSLFFAYYVIDVFTIKGVHYSISNYAVIAFPVSLLAFYNLIRSGRSNENLLFMLRILVFLAVAQSLLAFSQVTTGGPVFHKGGHGAEGEVSEGNRNYFAYILPGVASATYQATGSFTHFNSLGTFLAIHAPLAFALWMHYKTRFWGVMFYIVYWGVICTFSRGALLASTTAIMIIYFTATNHKIAKLYVAGTLGVFMYLAVEATLKTYVEETGNVNGRYDTWVHTIDTGMKEPLRLFFGYGMYYFKENLFGKAKGAHILFTLDNKRIYTNFHSVYVQMFLELGLVGVLLFVLGLLRLVIFALWHRSLWGYSLIGVVWAFGFNQAFDHTFFSLGIGSTFVIIIAVLATFMENTPPVRKPVRVKATDKRIANADKEPPEKILTE